MPTIENKFYLNLEEKKRILHLWDNEYPELLNLNSIQGLEQYFARTSSHYHYILRDNDLIIGWCMVFERDQANWFSILVDHEYTGKGLGRQLMNKVIKDYSPLYGWVVVKKHYLKKDGSKYHSPLNFYLKLGFKANYDVLFQRNGLEAIQITRHNH